MNRSPYQAARKRTSTLDRTARILIPVFVVLLLATFTVVFILVRDVVASWSITDLPGMVVNPGNDGPPTLPTGEAGLFEPMQPSNTGPEPTPWDGKSRVTVLVLGLDYRDWEAGEIPRSDTMILLTMDPITKTAGMLSIPRDLWVDIPGDFGYNKINTAYRWGEVYDLPGGGPALAIKTVEEVIGVPINYYAQIDFSAFERFIDEIEGVKLEVQEPITLVTIAGKKVPLEPGIYTLPGDLALAYARNRSTEGDDFSRSKRQMQVIMAVRDRILEFDMLPKLVTRAPTLYKELSSGIRTNLTPDQVIKLAWLAIQIDREKIKSGVIGPPNMVEIGFVDGQSVLFPVPDQIRLLRDEIFASEAPAVAANNGEDLQSLMTQEAARLSVQNGTYTEGLAGMTAGYLRDQGLNVVEETNASEMLDVTTIYLYNGKPYTAKYLSDLFAASNVTVRVYNKYDPNASVDVVLVLGSDWAANNPLGQ